MEGERGTRVMAGRVGRGRVVYVGGQQTIWRPAHRDTNPNSGPKPAMVPLATSCFSFVSTRSLFFFFFTFNFNFQLHTLLVVQLTLAQSHASDLPPLRCKAYS